MSKFKVNRDAILKKRDRFRNPEKYKTGDQNDSPFWKIPDGHSSVRIVTPADGDPFKEVYMHYLTFNGQSPNGRRKEAVVCPKRQFGQRCPICELATNLWFNGTPQDQTVAKKLFARERYYSPVLIRGSEEIGVKVFGYSSKMYNKMLDWVADESGQGTAEFLDTDDGYDVLVRRTPAAGPGAFPTTEIDLARNMTPLTEDKGFEDTLYENMPVIEELWGTPTFDEIDVILKAWLGEGADPEQVSNETTRYGNQNENANNMVRNALGSQSYQVDEDVPF
tara:strand:+ start:98 stop:934 length:837 start_codon:yes stop_codon:yes gene_type:complete